MFVFLMLSFLLVRRQFWDTASPTGGTQWYPRAGEVLRPDLPSVLSAGTRGSDKPAEKKNPKHQSKGELKHAM